MLLIENIKLAFQAVRSNLLRSVLTLLIIAFGIMALVGIMTAIDSAIFSLSDNLSRLGANSLSIVPAGSGPRGHRNGRTTLIGEPINYNQAHNFKEKYSFPSTVTLYLPASRSSVIRYQKLKTHPSTSIIGADENYLTVKGLSLSYGRNITKIESQNGAPIAIVGSDIIKNLFNDNPQRAINQSISIDNRKFRIIGIQKSKGTTIQQSEDNNIIIPLLNAKQYYATSSFSYKIDVSLNNANEIGQASAVAVGTLRNIRKLKAGQENDFEIKNSNGLVALIKENTSKFRAGATAIAIITLLGAAIGLMNIMLVSVTERTREVGISKALGATRKGIMIQFLSEAMLICQLGGIVGIFFGTLMGLAVSYFMNGPFVMPWNWIFLAFIICLIVGLLSGLYPAAKAAKLDPIESLRYE